MLGEFIPSLINQLKLDSNSQIAKKDLVLIKVECLNTITEICGKYPPIEL